MVRLGEIFTDGEEVEDDLALVKGKMPREAGTIDLPLSEHEQTARSKAARGVNLQEALTRWKVVSSMKEASLLAVTIETGRTHQIRRHLEAAGHPVAGRPALRRLRRQPRGAPALGAPAHVPPRLALELPHPTTGAPLRLEAPLPPGALRRRCRAEPELARRHGADGRPRGRLAHTASVEPDYPERGHRFACR